METLYEQPILDRFPHNATAGFYRKPDIPNNAQSRILNDYTKVNPNEVVAFYRYGSLLGNSGSILFTATHCWHPKGSFQLADLKGASTDGRFVKIALNQGGAMGTTEFRCNNAEDAQQLARFMDNLAFAPAAADMLEQIAPKTYEGYNADTVQWLEIRDEVLRTIDLLGERFQAGRLTLLEYEDAKAELLRRI